MTYETVIRALADSTRRSILERLAGAPVAVGDLAAELPVSRPAVSQHLRVLEEAGLVVAERDGARRLYRAEPAGLMELQRYLTQFWGQALRSYARRAHEESKRRDR